MSIWGLDEDFLEESTEKEEEQQASRGIPESGVYPVVIKKAYLSKSQGGATAFNVEMAELDDNPVDGEGRTLYYTGWIRSGDQKGNKATYTDAKGNEKPLPSWYEVNHLLKAAGLKLKDLTPVDAVVERFGNQEKVKVLPQLEGKKVKAVVRQYEDDYTGEVKLRYEIVDFLNFDGSATGKGRNEESWKAILEKNPVRKLKKTQENRVKEITEEAKEALDVWED